jgi:Flp pilus assembly protein TadD
MNLADLYRSQGQDNKGEPILRAAIEAVPQQAGPYHSLGLLLVRQRDYAQAEKYLARASALAPDNIRYGYVYAIALTSRGKLDEGLNLLTELHRRQPSDPELLYALVESHLQKGQTEQALDYAGKLQDLQPDNPEIQQIIRYLRQQR